MKASFFLALLLLGCSCNDDDLEDTYWHAVVTTPNGRRGVYCTDLTNGRTSCYRFISKNCPGGYVVLKDAEVAIMVECKKQEPGQ